MKSEYRGVLAALWIVGLFVSAGLIIAHLVMLDTDPFFTDGPEVDAVLNSHARVMLSLGVTFGAFIAWLVVGALTGRDPEPVAPRSPAVTTEPATD